MRIATIVGARPQFIKAWAVSRHLCSRAEEILIHTGQHYDERMSAIFFEELGMAPPDVNLRIGSGAHGEQTGRMLAAIETTLIERRPDCVLIYGDTNSTLAGALAAAKLKIPVAHVEAGLRSFNRRMPEEINRILADRLSETLFCPTDTAQRNLSAEGIADGVHVVGDVMHDALLAGQERARALGITARPGVVAEGPYILATIHRAENTDDPERLAGIVEAFLRVECAVVWPVHPRTRNRIAGATERRIAEAGNVRLIEPFSYLEMVAAESGAQAIVTDSGGVQKEAYILGVPCVTVRDETEWVETVATGWNTVVGADSERILAALSAPPRPSARPNLFGDGHAAERIATILVEGKA
ncbi:MAG: UDP-N-acetylglucosamine 2-epimerase (non-hydrolyzing) [Chloroflexota bacterium]|nr:MAG: UDP-N-acetylglucosamine 2-epimerase (non-hydrolyzing) [Chloroflexota bacterium]